MGSKKIRIAFSKDQKRELLDIISGDPDNFEKPTAQIFYKKISENANLLQGCEWTALRDMMRHEKILYNSAIDWQLYGTGGITGERKEQTVRKYILELCPNFDTLDIIFGGQLSEDIPDSMEVAEGEDMENTPKTPPVQEDGRASPLSIKEQLQRKPGGKIGGGTPSKAQLAQTNKDRMWTVETRLEIDEGLGEKRLDLEVQQFLWKMEKEKKKLELEEKKVMQERELRMKQIEEDTRIREKKIEEETKLKMEQMRQKFELDKIKIEKGIQRRHSL